MFVFLRNLSLSSALCFAFSLSFFVGDAHAQSSRRNQTSHTKAESSWIDPRAFEGNFQDPLIAIVSLRDQRLFVYDSDGLIASSRVSSGTRGYETPEGVFSIIQKKEEHYSNIYDEASMPFMQRITWSGIALHEGVVPGYPASHGCIRLPSGFAERFFKITRLNTRVIVSPYEVAPTALSHPTLFQSRPLATVSALVVAAADGMAAKEVEAGAATVAPTILAAAGEVTEQVNSGNSRLSQAREAAAAMKAAAAQTLTRATKRADEARARVKATAAESAKAERALRNAEAQRKRAEPRVADAERQVAAARNEQRAEKARAYLTKMQDGAAKAVKAAEDAKASALQKVTAAQEARDALKPAEDAQKAADAAFREASRASEPASVFVSRKLGRAFVRQGFQQVTDFPVTIRDPDKSIGTHSFTVTEWDANGDPQWTMVSVPEDLPAGAHTGSRKSASATPLRLAAAEQLQAGKSALDRIEFPDDLRTRVAPYLYPGASLVVSDLPLSIETGPGTDFVVLTRGEEQARQSIAKFVAKQKAEAAAKRAEQRYGRNDRRRGGGGGFFSFFDDD